MARGTEAKLPREIILAACAFTALGTGAIYMWSIFNKPLMAEFGFTTSEVSMTYSLFMLASCVSSLLAGWLQQRVQARWIVMGAGILFAAGWFCTSFATNLPMLYLFYGGFAGMGNGFLYNTIVSVATKWWPDRRGLASGICIGAIGLGPVFFAQIGNFLIETFDVMTAFRIVGIGWFVVYLVFSWMLYVPSKDWVPANWKEPSTDGEEAVVTKREVNLSAKQMVKDPLFYVLFILMLSASTSGLMITGHASNIGQELASLTATEGAIMVSVLAFGSFLGRLGFGALSDAIGRYNTLIIALALNAVVMLLFLGQATTFVTFLVTISLVGACFGASLTIMPAIVGDEFGSLHFGQNYSLVYPGYTVASFIGPMVAASTVETAGTYAPAFIVAGVISLIGIAIALAAKVLSKRLGDKKATMPVE